MANDDTYLEALKREREGYERYGRDDRAAQVDAEIKRHDRGEAPVETATTDAAPERAVPPAKATAARKRAAAKSQES